ncbi:MAG: membrane-bound O-acyltransferase family protein [Blastopirellula sp.]|mgnify:CR=1 FL=1|nr:membrane-bound O-acyltransferase family protein [Blastopirellula sp.]
MLFNGYPFLVFYAIVFAIYVLLARRTRAQNLLLLVASYVFYGAWDFRFLGLIALSTTVDYFAALAIERSASERLRAVWMGISMVANLGVLGVFKYLGFAAESFCDLAAVFQLTVSLPVAEIILPVGISFYTFQTLGYTLDVYRGRTKACSDPLAFAVYVSFFPQLVAGPIERANHFLPQIRQARTIRRVDLAIGTQFVLLGYFSKVVIADSMAPLVDQFYAAPERYGGSIAWLANLGFATQIYGDFAGYTLIARGISRWMGFRLISNFKQPYLADSPRDFWRRWHRSLSTWLRRNLYFELGGNRLGIARTCLNLMLTMLLGGLWHGASWNFVAWGGYQGLLLVIEHWLPDHRGGNQRPSLPRRLFYKSGTFLLMLVGWTLFRCSSLSEIGTVLQQMFFGNFYDSRALAFAWPILTAFTVMQLLDCWREKARSELILLRAPAMVRIAIYTFFVLSIMSVGFRRITFIYFQF